MKRISSVVFTLALLALVSLTRPAKADSVSAWCVGGLQVDGNVVKCVVDRTIPVTSSGGSLPDSSIGAVQSVRIHGTLSVDLRNLSQYMQGSRVEVPEQTLEVTLETSGAPLDLVVTLAPVITLDRQESGVKATGIELNVSSIRGNLPAWVTRVAMVQINRSQRIKGLVLHALNELFAHHP